MSGHKIYFTPESKRIALRENYKRWRESHLEIARERSKKWALSNPEKIKMAWNKWRVNKGYPIPITRKPKEDKIVKVRKVPVSRAISRRNYYLKNREKILESCKEWSKNNIEKVRIYKRVNKLKRRAAGVLKTRDIQFLYEKNIKLYGTLTCELCLKEILFGTDSIDHKVPISKGGGNSMDNLWVAHRECNIRKNDKSVEEFKNLLSKENLIYG